MDRHNRRRATSSRAGRGVALAAWIAGALAGSPASGQVEQGRYAGTAFMGGHGNAVACVGDVDGDGADDWLSGERLANTPKGLSGRVELHSGATGNVIRVHDGPHQAAEAGCAVAGLADVDLDGVRDYAVGMSGVRSGKLSNVGRVAIVSGATGALLVGIDGAVAGEKLGLAIAACDDADGDGIGDLVVKSSLATGLFSSTGTRLAALDTKGDVAADFTRFGDVDGDGVDEIAVGCPSYSGPLGGEGRLFWFSGATGLELARFDGAAADDAFGSQVEALDDLDGDGVAELLVASKSAGGSGSRDGLVEVRSGATFSVLRAHAGAFGQALGAWLGSGGDWDRDGVSDYFAASYNVLGPMGGVQIFSGATGAVVWEFIGEYVPSGHDHDFGSAIASGDWNGDGLSDVAIGAKGWHDAAFKYEGIVHVLLGCPAFATSYGAGFAGTLGAPALSITGVPELGASVAFAATNSLGAPTSGLLVVGTASASIPLRFGATLLVAPLAFEPIVVPTAGWSDGDAIPDDPALAFADFYLQVLELDPGAAGGLSLTNGLHLKLGYDL